MTGPPPKNITHQNFKNKRLGFKVMLIYLWLICSVLARSDIKWPTLIGNGF